VKVWRAVAGWAAALIIGGGGPLVASRIPQEKGADRLASLGAAPPSGWIEVSERSGRVEELRGEGWAPLATARVFGGLRVRTAGGDGRVVVKAGALTAAATLDAELSVSALADAPTLILESGQVLASSEVGPAVVFVPSFGVWLRGAKFGALVETRRLSVATLKELEITKPGHNPELFPGGQEILIDDDAMQPFVLASELQVRLSREKRWVSAMTSPTALLMVETSRGFEVILPDESGRAVLREQPRSLRAFDALGRVAVVEPVGRATAKRRVSVSKPEDDAIPLSIDMGRGTLGQAVINKPEASLPELKEESQSNLEKELGELDEETKAVIRDF
jgi:hypothetical protein